VDDASIDPPLSGICAGFESGQWRTRQLVTRLFDDVIDFALSHSERQAFNSDTGVLMLGRAMRKIYTSEKYARRGEFGELLLHVALREVFNTETAISKIFFKDGSNETVKGFDAVHVVDNGTGLELWLGEVKFYNRLSAAIRDVVGELHDHVDANYLRSEFLAVEGKIDSSWKHAPKLLSMIHEDASLDDIFENVTIPVLLTYDSAAVAARVAGSSDESATPSDIKAAYRIAFEEEVRKGWHSFVAAGLPSNVRIRLILVPLHLKKALVDALDERLKLWQEVTA